jgi:hypothetical protein
VNYLDKSRVTKYIALEPNKLMHPNIRMIANAAGFTESAGNLLILPYGAENTYAIVSAMDGNYHSVDTIISVLTLCSVPSPERTLRTLIHDILKPAGLFLFYEHVQSPRVDVAWWQTFWTPVWKTLFDGCRLDRPTHIWVDSMPEGTWKKKDLWDKQDESEEHLFYHKVGKFVKS